MESLSTLTSDRTYLPSFAATLQGVAVVSSVPRVFLGVKPASAMSVSMRWKSILTFLPAVLLVMYMIGVRQVLVADETMTHTTTAHVGVHAGLWGK